MERRLDTLQKIEIAEGVEIDLRPAGLFVRGGAFILDGLVKIGVMIGLGTVFSLLGGIAGIAGGEELGSGITMGLYSFAAFLMEWGYSVFFEASAKGATPGKRVFKIKVAQFSGAPITFNQAVVRSLLRVVDLLPAMGAIGLISILSTRRFQRLGDLAADTVVVYSGEIDILRREDSAIIQGDTLRPMVNLTREEQMAILLYAERARDWTTPRQEELAGHAGGIVTTTNKRERVAKLFGVARWIRSNQ